MDLFRHIVVATDFGEASDAAVDLASRLAAESGAKLTLVHAYTIPSQGYAEAIPFPADALRRAAEEAMASSLARVRQSLPGAEGIVTYGVPWGEILRVAKGTDADLIVLGTHGRRGLSRVFLGSVAERVVRLSPLPVLTVSGHRDRVAKEHARDQADATAE